MGLKDLLLQRAGNPGNLGTPGEVTGKAVSNHSGNLGNLGNVENGECATENEDAGGVAAGNRLTRPLLSEVTKVTEVTALKTIAESGNLNAECEVTEVTGCLEPAGDVALGTGDPGDSGLEWHGEVEYQPAPRAEPASQPPKHAPAKGSLVARLVAAGATVNTWSVGRGGQASVRAPAGIPLELVNKVEARGWRVIPGGRANAEAEHDSWAFGGVGIRELD
jgi:hypothetical protein